MKNLFSADTEVTHIYKMTAILKLLKLACLPHGHFTKWGMLPTTTYLLDININLD
jgi:hypothetical protein